MKRYSTKIAVAIVAILAMTSSASAVTAPTEKLTLWYTQAADATNS